MVHISTGDSVVINSKYYGIIKYIGEIEGKSGRWVGVELDEPIGKNDGTYGGIRYFECRNKRGLFVKENKIEECIEEREGRSKSETSRDENVFNIRNNRSRIDLSKIDSTMLSTEEIINKYSNYKGVTEDKNNNDNDNSKSVSARSNILIHTNHAHIINLIESIYTSYMIDNTDELNNKYDEYVRVMAEYGIKV